MDFIDFVIVFARDFILELELADRLVLKLEK